MARTVRNFLDDRGSIDWRHPLAIGRQFWGLASPGNIGGSIYHDVTKRGNDGVLTAFANINAGSDGWANGNRPGGSGALLFNGSSSYVVLPATTSLNIFGSDITLACSVNWVATGFSNHIFGGYLSSGSFAGYGLRYDSTSGKIQFWDSTSWRTSTIVPAIGSWHRMIATVNTVAGSSTVSFYLDGVFQSAVGCTQPASYLGARAIGAKQGSGEWANCYLDDLVIVSRGWDATLAALDTDLSRRGNPALLPRVRRSSLGFTATVVYSGAGAAQLSAFTLAATGSAAAPIYAGTAAPQLSAVLLAAAGSAVPPNFAGTLAAQLSAVRLVAAGLTTGPVPAAGPDWTKTQSIDATAVASPGPDPTRTKSTLR